MTLSASLDQIPAQAVLEENGLTFLLAVVCGFFLLRQGSHIADSALKLSVAEAGPNFLISLYPCIGVQFYTRTPTPSCSPSLTMIEKIELTGLF